MKEIPDYSIKLKKAEKLLDSKKQVLVYTYTHHIDSRFYLIAIIHNFYCSMFSSRTQSELSRGSPSQKDSAAHRQSIDKAGTLSGGVSQHRDHDRFRVAGERPTSDGSGKSCGFHLK